MKRYVILAGMFLFFCPWLSAGDVNLNRDNYEKIKRHVVPAREEMAFTEIDWRTSFWEGLQEAQKKKRPILLWTMNGHPLGRT